MNKLILQTTLSRENHNFISYAIVQEKTDKKNETILIATRLKGNQTKYQGYHQTIKIIKTFI